MDWEHKSKPSTPSKNHSELTEPLIIKPAVRDHYLRIDAHQHFWRYDPVNYDWITTDMAVIQKDFLPAHLEPILQQSGFDGCVAVQAQQSEEETHFLLRLADDHEFIRGVVGWVDLQAGDLEQRLEHYSGYPKLKGFRHVLQGEPKRDIMLSPAFVNGIDQLQRFGFTYDILIYPDQLNFIKKLVAQFPSQRFIVDHIAKPQIAKGYIKEWKDDMEQLAKHQNVFCKISGMVTEADWKNWKKEDLHPYLDIVAHTFGVDRLAFGSDWPVCLVAASYAEVVNIVEDYFSSFSTLEKEKVFGKNAIDFYKL